MGSLPAAPLGAHTTLGAVSADIQSGLSSQAKFIIGELGLSLPGHQKPKGARLPGNSEPSGLASAFDQVQAGLLELNHKGRTTHFHFLLVEIFLPIVKF